MGLVQVLQWFVTFLLVPSSFDATLDRLTKRIWVCAFGSLLTGAHLPTHIAMTGEVKNLSFI